MKKNNPIPQPNEEDEHKIDKIQRHTDYSRDTCIEQLLIHNGDENAVIDHYYKMHTPPPPPEKPKSINQLIYQQCRRKLGTQTEIINTNVAHHLPSYPHINRSIEK